MGFFLGIKKSSSTRDEGRRYAPMACRYCGLNDYGNSCEFSPGYYPNKLGPHKHGHDGLRCIYCGLPYHPGRSCNFGPNNYHSL